MKPTFDDIEQAFEFVSFGPQYTNEAYLDRQTGEIFYRGEDDDPEERKGPNEEELEDERYVQIPHRYDLELGKRLVDTFVRERLPDHIQNIRDLFRGSGAYGRYKSYLERIGKLQEWFDYEAESTRKALKAWCGQNTIELSE